MRSNRHIVGHAGLGLLSVERATPLSSRNDRDRGGTKQATICKIVKNIIYPYRSNFILGHTWTALLDDIIQQEQIYFINYIFQRWVQIIRPKILKRQQSINMAETQSTRHI